MLNKQQSAGIRVIFSKINPQISVFSDRKRILMSHSETCWGKGSDYFSKKLTGLWFWFGLFSCGFSKNSHMMLHPSSIFYVTKKVLFQGRATTAYPQYTRGPRRKYWFCWVSSNQLEIENLTKFPPPSTPNLPAIQYFVEPKLTFDSLRKKHNVPQSLTLKKNEEFKFPF